MNENIAQMKLMTMTSEYKEASWVSTVVRFTNLDLPPEITMRLKELWSVTKKIGGHAYEIGKILVLKILDFILAHPGIAIGILLGVVIGSLINMIPFIGSFLAPLALAVGLFFGILNGHRIDKIANGEMSSLKDSNFFRDLITAGKEFWVLLAEILDALKQYFK